jgi:hypothetical protein
VFHGFGQVKLGEILQLCFGFWLKLTFNTALKIDTKMVKIDYKNNHFASLIK